MSINAIRIEHENGWGIFRYDSKSGYKYKEFTEDYSHYYHKIVERHSNFKSISQDFPKNCEYTDYYCAYKSLDQLAEWVLRRELEVLIKNGFTVYLYELSECEVGEDQIFFKLENVISKKDINSLFE